jgi:5-methylthioribose kinase
MLLLDPCTTEFYLLGRGHLSSDEPVRIVELSGGVSNQVLLVERGRGDRFVLKQAREQLRCDIRRIWREIDVLRLADRVLADSLRERSACVPKILFEDRENYCYAMTAAPPDHRTWKEQLLAGNVQPSLALNAASLLGTLHAATWHDTAAAETLADRSYFHALRIDPYYRRIAEVHPRLRPMVERLIASLDKHRLSLVHGDFSPKNLLTWSDKLLLVDFEVGHFGDPAFDNGFFLSHLFLKAIHLASHRAEVIDMIGAFWRRYAATLSNRIGHAEFEQLEVRSLLNLAACVLARVDGKSPVDYLAAEEQNVARTLAFELFDAPPSQLDQALATLRDCCCR